MNHGHEISQNKLNACSIGVQVPTAPWKVPFQAGALVPFSLGYFKGRTRALTALSLAVLAKDANHELREARESM